MTAYPLTLEPIDFATIEGWADDDHLAAFEAYARSPRPAVPAGNAAIVTRAAARAFFEQQFQPHRVVCTSEPGLLTGYYEPEIAASRTPSDAYTIPIYARPPDLVNIVSEAERGAKADAGLTHMRQTPDGRREPYATRAEIEAGALVGRGLELFYAADFVEVFFMQVQGSGLVRLPDGRGLRITYDGKNGHPYTSIGRYLIEQGAFTREAMTLQALTDWLKADPERARPVLQQNASYVFFRVLGDETAVRAEGVEGVPLTPGRSLAVDTAVHALGTPVWVESETLRHADDTGQGFARLMIAQDVGSAIRGPERGDIYFGSGAAAGERAGLTKHPARFTVLRPKTAAEASS